MFTLLLRAFYFLVIIFPHLFWLAENNYKTIFYGFKEQGAQELFRLFIFSYEFFNKTNYNINPINFDGFFLLKSFKIKLNAFKEEKNIFLLFTTFSYNLNFFNFYNYGGKN